jgi:hypothetical protein
MTGHAESTADRALAYAGHGWPVFPCRPGAKEPATRHGFHDATTDPERITSWWRRAPDANLAIATGLPGPDILDVDQRGEAGDGFAAFSSLSREGLVSGAAALVRTPGGGFHAYFTGTGQACGRLPGHHLDFKAAGGYVLAPPSRVDGKPYELIGRQAGSASLDWAAVKRLLDPPQPRPARHPDRPGDVGHLAAWVAKLEEGNRQAGLFWAACRAIEAGRGGDLDSLADAAAATGLPETEIRRTIRLAPRYARPVRPRAQAAHLAGAERQAEGGN